jgi:uncharacterized protein YerC
VTTTHGPENLPIDAIDRDIRAWPRSSLDHQRVAEFVSLYEDGGIAALPPLEVLVDQEGNFLLYDGHHRFEALQQLGFEDVPVFALEVREGDDPIQLAFERAIAVSSTAAKPLTRTERRWAVVRLLQADSSRSDREVARISGASPTTVGRIRRELASPEPNHGESDEADRYIATLSAKEIARRAFRALERIRDTKGFGIADGLLGDRTSVRFARVLTAEFGNEALERAVEYRTWIDGAIRHLEEVDDA